MVRDMNIYYKLFIFYYRAGPPSTTRREWVRYCRKIPRLLTRITAVRMTEPIYSSPSLNGIFPERSYLQNIPSMLAAHYLEVSNYIGIL